MIEIDCDNLQKILNSNMELMDMQSKINTYEKDQTETIALIFEAEYFQETLIAALNKNKKFIANQKKVLNKIYGITYKNGVLNFKPKDIKIDNELGAAIGKKLNKMVSKNNNK